MKKTLTFKHDYGARNDPKLQRLLFDVGAAGGFVWWVVVEMLYEQGGYIPRNYYKEIAYCAHCKEEIVRYVVEESGLFLYDDEKIWSNRVLAELEMKDHKSLKAKESVSVRWKNNEYERNTNVIRTYNERNTNVFQEEIKESNKENKEEKEILSNDNTKKNGLAADAPLSALASQSRPKAESLDWVKDKFNEICVAYPKIVSLSEKRKNKIRLRLEEMRKTDPSRDLLAEVFLKMQASKFLKGDNPRGWKANFDWVIENPTNWVKILEGNFDDRVKKTDVERSTGMPLYKNKDYWDD